MSELVSGDKEGNGEPRVTKAVKPLTSTSSPTAYCKRTSTNTVPRASSAAATLTSSVTPTSLSASISTSSGSRTPSPLPSSTSASTKESTEVAVTSQRRLRTLFSRSNSSASPPTTPSTSSGNSSLLSSAATSCSADDIPSRCSQAVSPLIGSSSLIANYDGKQRTSLTPTASSTSGFRSRRALLSKNRFSFDETRRTDLSLVASPVSQAPSLPKITITEADQPDHHLVTIDIR